MATYYRRDNMESPYIGDQKLASYSELPSHHNNMTIYGNQASAAGLYSEYITESSLSPHNCAEIATVGGRNEMMFIPPTSDTINLQSIDGNLTATGNPVGNHVRGDSQVVSRAQLSILDSEQNLQYQGLSLSLGTEMQSAVSAPSFQYSNLTLPSSSSSPHLPVLGKWTLSCESDENKVFRNSECLTAFFGGNHNPIKAEISCNPQCFGINSDIHTDKYVYETSGYANAISNSKYLKAGRQLLDEMVNISKALKQVQSNKRFDDAKENDGKASTKSITPTSSGISSGHNESISNSSSELSSAERQDLQNNKTKLFSMLDEVDRRYKQYYHQMQIVVSSFDMVVGHGAAKSYTALALQTISRHCRCLRDAISNQIEIVRRRLGEQDTSPNGGISRLRFVDQQLRQQRALQQLGVMQHPWRPQRGLPESSVSILRAWLFEHFLHPYPNDSEKIMLAKQTGLTRNQVANWFINARVRLWKPMVEEIYKEEFADSDAYSKSSLDDASKALEENQLVSENGLDELQDSVTSTAADSNRQDRAHKLRSDSIPDIEMKKPIAKTRLQHNSNMDEQSPYLDKNILGNQHCDGSLMPAALSCDISELSGFAIGTQVSLALGLQHNESDAFPMSDENHIRVNNITASSMGPDSMDYNCMNTGKQQDRFDNSHLLHDFVV